LFAYLNSMPDMRAAAYQAARPLWATGVTSEMVTGCYFIIETIEQMWLRLARWFPPNHFSRPAADYFGDYLNERATWRRALAEPTGAGKHGTSVFVITAEGLMEEAERALVQTVRALVSCYGNGLFDIEAWQQKWDEASRD
jgi:hypothetical protein